MKHYESLTELFQELSPVRKGDERSAVFQAHLGEHEPAHVRTVTEILQTKGHVEVKLFLGPRETCRAGQRTPHTPARRHRKPPSKDHK